MKQHIFKIISSIFFCFILLKSAFPHFSERSVILIPKGYKGDITIIYAIKNGQPTEYEHKKRVYRIPKEGILYTKFCPNFHYERSFCPRTLKNDYSLSIEKITDFFYVDEKGIRTPLAQPPQNDSIGVFPFSTIMYRSGKYKKIAYLGVRFCVSSKKESELINKTDIDYGDFFTQLEQEGKVLNKKLVRINDFAKKMYDKYRIGYVNTPVNKEAYDKEYFAYYWLRRQNSN